MIGINYFTCDFKEVFVCEMCNKIEYIGHLEGMLNRDLRTAKIPVYSLTEEVSPKFGFSEKMENSFATETTEIIRQHSCHPSRTKSTLSFKWKKVYSLRNYWKSNYNHFFGILI